MGSHENLRLTERLTRVGPEILNYEFTVNDPTMWTAPWTAMIPLKHKNERSTSTRATKGTKRSPTCFAVTATKNVSSPAPRASKSKGLRPAGPVVASRVAFPRTLACQTRPVALVLTLRTPPAVVRRRSNNQLGSELMRSAVANQRRRAPPRFRTRLTTGAGAGSVRGTRGHDPRRPDSVGDCP